MEAFPDALDYFPRLLVASEKVTYGTKHDRLITQESRVLKARVSQRRNRSEQRAVKRFGRYRVRSR